METGDFVVDDIQICREAAKELSLDFDGSENISRHPKGCFQHTYSGSVEFNLHPNGYSDSYGHQICKPRGKR